MSNIKSEGKVRKKRKKNVNAENTQDENKNHSERDALETCRRRNQQNQDV